MQEIFKDIKGYEGLYQVSNLGNVKSYKQYKKGRILIPQVNKIGYAKVVLTNNIAKNCLVHRLVALAFIPNIQSKKEVNHINGVKHDNRLENLEWATRLQNMEHAVRTGLQKSGKEDSRSKPVIQFTLDNIIVANYSGANEAARQLGCYVGSISNCCNGRSKTASGFKWQYKI